MHRNIPIVILFPRSLSAGVDWNYFVCALNVGFFNMIPLPNDATTLATLSTEMYDSEHNSGFMPSLTLEPEGLDRS